MVDRAGHHVARRELGARVEIGHEAMAGVGDLELPALAAHRLGDQEVLDLQIVEAGRVELHELHVGDAAARPPGHGDAVAGRAARRGREEVDAARPARRQDGRAGGERLDPVGRAVEGIDAPDIAARPNSARSWRLVTRSITTMSGTRVMLGWARAALSRACCTAQPVASSTWTMRRWLCPPSRVRCHCWSRRDVERHAELRQPLDRRRRAFDDELDGRPVVEPGAGDHRVLDMAVERVARLEHRRHPALRPGGRAFVEPALGEHHHLEAAGEVDRRGQPGRAGADDQDVGDIGCRSRPTADPWQLEPSRVPAALAARVRLRNTSSRSGLAGRDVDDAVAVTLHGGEHLAGIRLVLAIGDHQGPLALRARPSGSSLSGAAATSRSTVTSTTFSCAIADQGPGRLVGDHLAVIDDRDPVAELLGFLEIMGGQDDGHALPVELADITPRAAGAIRRRRPRWARRAPGSAANGPSPWRPAAGVSSRPTGCAHKRRPCRRDASRAAAPSSAARPWGCRRGRPGSPAPRVA